MNHWVRKERHASVFFRLDIHVQSSENHQRRPLYVNLFSLHRKKRILLVEQKERLDKGKARSLITEQWTGKTSTRVSLVSKWRWSKIDNWQTEWHVRTITLDSPDIESSRSELVGLSEIIFVYQRDLSWHTAGPPANVRIPMETFISSDVARVYFQWSKSIVDQTDGSLLPWWSGYCSNRYKDSTMIRRFILSLGLKIKSQLIEQTRWTRVSSLSQRYDISSTKEMAEQFKSTCWNGQHQCVNQYEFD